MQRKTEPVPTPRQKQPRRLLRGGAYIVDMVEAALGHQPVAGMGPGRADPDGGRYDLPAVRDGPAGIVLSLERQEEPDTGGYQAPEIVQRIRKRHHAGLIFASPSAPRIAELLDEHVARFYQDFHASAPPLDRPVD